ncbi:MAG: metal ABC transporter substrate-binding protein [Candidatus Latescibacteria bacterium]|jgi:zinc/manganese transport system substrate-binding protein|nr:metal ABC transporter substrate-binding protein [Candidatus Latescibacterota bacterium]
MKNILAIPIAICILTSNAFAQLRVVTTTTDLAAIVHAIGGKHTKITAIAKGYQDPHYVQAKPSYMRQLNRADLLVYTGLELEVGWLPLIIQGARNPKITLGAPGHLNASVGITPLEIPEGQMDRSMGDIHPEGNPHYLLDPRNGLTVAQTIAKKLSELTPEHTGSYQKNLKQFDQNLQTSIKAWKIRLQTLQNKHIVTHHKLWEYLANWLQITIIDQIEKKPGVPPSPRHVAELVSRIKTGHIPFLFCSNVIDPKPAKRVADRANIQLLVLPASVGGEPEIKTYTDLFETIVTRLETAAKGSL